MPSVTALTASAVLFDLDGVLTPTADLHMRAWAEMFGALLTQHRAAPFTDRDYFRYLDGRTRYAGVAAVLASRGLDLPWGDPGDPTSADTVCGVGNRKNDVFFALLEQQGIAPYPGSLALLDRLQSIGVAVAVVSSSKNAVPVLQAAHLADRFPVIVDGLTAEREHLASKPDPAMYLAAARRVGAVPSGCVVVEDAISGVASGAAGGFGLVIGVDRGAGADALHAAGADVVVRDLAELLEEAA
ncbi:HAD family hydrolase [uncultured Amnibacterium sp.]|uniref:HAD family hydrolase n=1 Tax=uncultured Amnibacterium sp. TaxID=1631851 RepID=UPI0035CC4433